MTVFAFMWLSVGLCVFGFWVWSLIDCLTRPDNAFEPIFGSVNQKIVWALIIFFVGPIGSIIYIFAAGTKANPKCSVPQTHVAETDEGRRILEMIAGGKITAAEGQRLLAALEIKGQRATTGKMGASTSKALKIGCLLLIIIPILLILALFLARYYYWKAPQTEIEKGEIFEKEMTKSDPFSEMNEHKIKYVGDASEVDIESFLLRLPKTVCKLKTGWMPSRNGWSHRPSFTLFRYKSGAGDGLAAETVGNIIQSRSQISIFWAGRGIEKRHLPAAWFCFQIAAADAYEAYERFLAEYAS